MMNREYTLQYMEGQDWVRVTAIYDTLSGVKSHALMLLEQGRVIRLLARPAYGAGTWFTVKPNTYSDGMVLDNPIYGCPR